MEGSASRAMVPLRFGTTVTPSGNYTTKSARIRKVQNTQQERNTQPESTEKIAINVTSTELFVGVEGCGVSVTVINNGLMQLSVTVTDALVDGVYQSDRRDVATISNKSGTGDSDTAIWLCDQTLSANLTDGGDTSPTRNNAVADSDGAASVVPTGDVPC